MALKKTQSTVHPARVERQRDRDCGGLVQQLQDTNPEVRRWAARDLADCPESAQALIDRLHNETDHSVREIIFTTLTRIGNERAVTGLVACLRSEDTGLRNEAIEAMKQLPQAMAPIMRGLLQDQDSDLRIFAVNILESLRHPDVEQWLTEVIETDPHVNVCGTAVDLMGEVGSQAALSSLQRLKARFASEPYIQFASDLAIKRIQES